MRSAHGLAVLLAAAGITHFAAPRVYDAVVPRTSSSGGDVTSSGSTGPGR